MEQVLKKEKQIQAKPIMKWAGGKTQMLGDIMPKIPQKYGKYIEPFIGGGALFFALSPDKAIIADSNPELINMYRQVADNVEVVISYLKKYKNTKEDFEKIELRVGKIVKCEKHPKADKLLVSQIKLGSEMRQIVSGIAEWYKPEEMVGKNVIVVCNLKPVKLRGVESQGMILAAGDDGDDLVIPEAIGAKDGAEVR